MTFDILKAIILGIVEGLTEFVPVSSTGHLLLVQRFFGFADEDFGKTFAVLIQFGAILALLSIYFVRLWKLALGFFTDPAARRQRVLGVRRFRCSRRPGRGRARPHRWARAVALRSLPCRRPDCPARAVGAAVHHSRDTPAPAGEPGPALSGTGGGWSSG